jgi:hypothetical protein
MTHCRKYNINITDCSKRMGGDFKRSCALCLGKGQKVRTKNHTPQKSNSAGVYSQSKGVLRGSILLSQRSKADG